MNNSRTALRPTTTVQAGLVLISPKTRTALVVIRRAGRPLPGLLILGGGAGGHCHPRRRSPTGCA